MRMLPDVHISRLADYCVANMGDIFWDYDEQRDASRGFREPSKVATDSVIETLREFATSLESSNVYSNAIRMEYRELVVRLGDDASDKEIREALISDAAWTSVGAGTVLGLAKQYGMSILRNALALAEAMDIEDGDIGL